jgi:hypothetical protein
MGKKDRQNKGFSNQFSPPGLEAGPTPGAMIPLFCAGCLCIKGEYEV